LNEEDERRCVRCGRRLHLAAPRPAPDMYPITGAAAPALEALPGGRRAFPETTPAEVPYAPEGGYQPSLFREPPPGPRILPIPMLTPRPHAAERKSPRPASSTGSLSGRGSSRTARRGADSQQSLDFLNSGSSGAHPLGTEVEAVIYCDAPVALPVHRMMAAAADASMMAIAVGLFLMIFCLSGGHIVVTERSALLAVVIIGAVAFLYRLLWCLGNGDTPGMRFAGLRLVNFDGRPPDRDQRLLRLGASVLSLASAGLGFVWALVDEESLTWHDHISKTFPSPG
jgi:uncharacterized RDD family membrane protein YckC